MSYELDLSIVNPLLQLDPISRGLRYLCTIFFNNCILITIRPDFKGIEINPITIVQASTYKLQLDPISRGLRSLLQVELTLPTLPYYN